MGESEKRTDGRISRRRMLKRVGAGAAIAWTAPVLTSLRPPAFAASGCSRTCTGCYASSTTCGTEVSVTCGEADDHLCLCSQTIEGDCFCGLDVFTAILSCTTSADCSGVPGARCMQICGYYCQANACLAPCGSTVRAPASRDLGAPASVRGRRPSQSP